MEEVVAAAKAARIHSYIMRLPQGYNTVISEDGGNISKGQRQLLTIARAMLYDTHMLILDEATSNVDTNAERQVQKAIRSLMAGKTCFAIAQRVGKRLCHIPRAGTQQLRGHLCAAGPSSGQHLACEIPQNLGNITDII